MCLYVDRITKKEGNKIKSILRHSKDRVAIKRAQVILLSAQGQKVQEIAPSVYLTEEYVRKLIHRFNKERSEIFNIHRSPGQPIQFTEEIKSEIIEIALSPPSLLGQPFSRWSLEKIKEYLLKKKIVKTISIETVRTTLKENKISYQRTKTWKESNDPEFERKKNG
jgi:transposase